MQLPRLPYDGAVDAVVRRRLSLLPAGITFFGRPWSEATLLGAAFAYEQATGHRRPPPTTPPVR